MQRAPSPRRPLRGLVLAFTVVLAIAGATTAAPSPSVAGGSVAASSAPAASTSAAEQVEHCRGRGADRFCRTAVIEPRVSLSPEQARALDRSRPTVPRKISKRKAFRLSSRPRAKKTIYLDFNGANMKRSGFYREFPRARSKKAAPFSLDNKVGRFSSVELSQIHRTWLAVANAYSPFDVNVTTKAPKKHQLERKNRRDKTYGVAVVVTSKYKLGRACRCGGIAFIDVFSAPTKRATPFRTALVFSDQLPRDFKRRKSRAGGLLGVIAAHEAGHTFGLQHDGRRQDGGRTEYYQGTPRWSPIMGAGPGVIQQFDKGQYRGATNKQNDLLILKKQLGKVRDDHPDDPRRGRGISNNSRSTGFIGYNDRDVFRFGADGQQRVTLLLDPLETRNTQLDLQLTLIDPDGAVVDAKNHPTSGSFFNARGTEVSMTFTPPESGFYTVVVEGGSTGDSSSGGGNGYGSYGAYRLRVNQIQS